MGDDAAAEPRRHQWPQSDLDDVPAEQQHDTAPRARRARHAGHHGAQVARREHIGQPVEKRGEGAIAAGRCGEERRLDLVAPGGDGDRPHPAEIGLLVGHAQAPAGAPLPGMTMFFSRSVMVPKGNLVRICTGSRRSSSVSQTRVSERLENSPLVSITG